MFNTAVSSDTTQTALIAVDVEAEDGTLLGVGYFKSILGAGDSELTLGFQVPEDAVTGIANVYVNVYMMYNLEVIRSSILSFSYWVN